MTTPFDDTSIFMYEVYVCEMNTLEKDLLIL